MKVRTHLLVPPHFLVSTASKKMRWKDEFGKWFPKLPNKNLVDAQPAESDDTPQTIWYCNKK